MFQSVRHKKVFEEILDQIKEMLVNEQLSVGQRIPSEIRLAETLGVSRSSLREALRILDVLGIIEAKTGEGTVIRKADPENLKNLMTLVAVSGGIDTVDLYEARCAIEVEAAMLAAARHTAEDLRTMERALKEMDECRDAEASAHSDYLFHRAIVRASQNDVLKMMMSFISDLLGEQIRDTRSRLAPEILDRFQVQHWMIFEGIAGCNPEAAGKAVREHLTYAQEKMGFLRERGLGR
ncbi:FadR/GntR family transcriptional regulator [Kyrpidia tusciae]|uniref:GntR domain protein n=1 Tax=Kyrpidia tusciae (strain DSM 2912 / NBRC 15312 / T2) TaxID=562970 RepID=D5WTR5_KYRT2|nr:FadR/GntR family transcriptional regulator [Kyrpidia tusciae]ADG05235.1 GntR domain protein [Kyrpidia tusciae DSM 2912]